MSYKLQQNLSRLGSILLNFSFIGLFCVLSVLFSQILVLLIYLLLILIGMLSLFTLFFNDQFRQLFDVTNSFNDLILTANQYFPLIIGLSLSLVFCSILCMIGNYKDIRTRRKLIVSILLFVVLLVLWIVGSIGGGTHA